MFKAFKKAVSGFVDKLATKPLEKVSSKEEISKDKTVKKTKPVVKKDKVSKPKVVKKPVSEAPKEEKQGFFKGLVSKVTETKISEDKFNELFDDFELELLQNNVAFDIVEEIKNNLKSHIVNKSLKRIQVAKIVEDELKKSVYGVFEGLDVVDLEKNIKAKKPYVILFVGVNGVGKTTSLAKLAYQLKKKHSLVMAAGDTFRAAAIEQLQSHADKLDIKIIKHQYGADSAAVAFDAIKHAEAKKVDVVLIDTAGRSHANADLMDELVKIKRVAKPDFTLLVVDSLTGNDAVTQAKDFNDKIGIDGTILTKVDANERGGAIVSVAYETKKPILYLGLGQTYDDLKKFDINFLEELF